MIHYWFASAQGWRPTMEDRHVVNERGNWVLFAVCDGHGGREVVDQLAEWLPDSILGSLPTRSLSCQRLKETLRNAILNLDRKLYQALSTSSIFLWSSKPIRSGSTLLLCVYNRVSQQIAIASVGDSRAVLCNFAGKIIGQTKDHKPSEPEEKARVEASGSFIERNRVGGVLAMSRAMGDFQLKKTREGEYDPERGPVSANPQLFAGYLTGDSTTLILACDGVWDVMSSEAAVSLIQKEGMTNGNIADRLMRNAFEEGSRDNITAMIVQFRIE
jgi:serine/threonine protein phosphatase PrpC